MKKTFLITTLSLFALTSFCQTTEPVPTPSSNAPKVTAEKKVQIRYVAVFTPEDIQDLTLFLHNLDMYSEKGRNDIVAKFLERFRIVQIPDSVAVKKETPSKKKP